MSMFAKARVELFVVWVAIGLLVGSVGTVGAQEVVLRIAGLNAPTAPLTLADYKLSELVKERTNGRVLIKVFPAGQLGNQVEVSEGVRAGTIDITNVNISIFGKYVPGLNIFGAGYLFKDREHLFQAIEGPVGQTLLETLRTKYGVRALGFPWYGTRHVTSNVPIYGPKDLKGLKLRAEPEEAAVKAIEAMGAKATPMSFSELYTSLKTGIVDGQENPIPTIYATKFYEVQRYLNLTAHKTVATMWAMHEKTFQKLTPEQQSILLRSAKEAAQYCAQITIQRTSEDLLKLIDAGMHVINSDREAFRKQVLPPMIELVQAKYITDPSLFQKFKELVSR